MVTNKKLKKIIFGFYKEIADIKNEIKSLKESIDTKKEVTEDNNDKVQEWLKDERVDDAQVFLHRGAK